jgi:hypothetical protein
VHRLRKERCADRRLLELKELVADEAHDEARLAHRGLAQQHQLEVARRHRDWRTEGTRASRKAQPSARRAGRATPSKTKQQTKQLN